MDKVLVRIPVSKRFSKRFIHCLLVTFKHALLLEMEEQDSRLVSSAHLPTMWPGFES